MEKIPSKSDQKLNFPIPCKKMTIFYLLETSVNIRCIKYKISSIFEITFKLDKLWLKFIWKHFSFFNSEAFTVIHLLWKIKCTEWDFIVYFWHYFCKWYWSKSNIGWVFIHLYIATYGNKNYLMHSIAPCAVQ